MKECSACVHVERYQGRLCCTLHKCSCPFARDGLGQCGPDAKNFEARQL